jgi:ribosome biogenesis GTPase
VSAVTGDGCDAVLDRIGPGTTAVLVGSSGVGKSTLLNRFAGAEVMSTGEVRLDDDEGRHTTTHRELILLPNGGILIDTPGIRELQLWSAEEGLEAAFSDIDELTTACRFSDCSHESEPGCAIQAAIADGSLTEERYASWRKLQAELRAIAARQDALVARDEKRKWKLLAADEKTRTRNR